MDPKWYRLKDFLINWDGNECPLTSQRIAEITGSTDVRQNQPRGFPLNHQGEYSIRRWAAEAGFSVEDSSEDASIKIFKRI